MAVMARQPKVEASRELAVVLQDLAWLLPRTLGAIDAPGVESLPGSELEVMRLLVRRPGLSVGDVARELGLQTTNASTAVRSLIGRGLVRRRRDAADGRLARLFPTPRAIRNRETREVAWGAALAARLEQLPPAEAAALLACAAPLRTLSALLGERDASSVS
jgi:DNA-binding MarR family transcriptional regulator